MMNLVRKVCTLKSTLCDAIVLEEMMEEAVKRAVGL